MQFTGHSLLVHQSMSVPWDFYLVPYFSQPAYAISSHNCHRNVSLPSSASLWNGMFDQVEGQYATLSIMVMLLTCHISRQRKEEWVSTSATQTIAKEWLLYPLLFLKCLCWYLTIVHQAYLVKSSQVNYSWLNLELLLLRI